MDGDKVNPVTLQVLNGLIESQTKLRDAAEKRWSFAREALFNLARLVAADWLEERQQQKGGLELVRIEELSRVVFERVAALHSAYVHPDAEQLRKAQTRITELNGQLEQSSLLCNGLQRDRDEANLEITRLKTQAENNKPKAAQAAASAPVAAPRPVSTPELALPSPNWYQEWATSEGFEKQAFIIRLMGDTGLSLRPEIMKALTDKYEAARTSGACVRAFTHLVELEFILTAETEGGLKGRPPQTVRLGRLGESAYILLTGKQPAQAEFDEIRSAHSTDAHTLLILKAAKILETEGYEILRKGEMAFTLPDGRTTSPDILARKNGKELHVEVERDTGKGDANARERKWQNAFDAGQGYLYVFCETEALQKRLSQEIKHALASEARLERANLYMTNLDAIGKNQRHPDGSLWVSQKKP
jgi:hypothetical protein